MASVSYQHNYMYENKGDSESGNETQLVGIRNLNIRPNQHRPPGPGMTQFTDNDKVKNCEKFKFLEPML